MATLEKKIEVETRVRAMLEAEGTPMPDRVEYGDGCVRLFWIDSKTVLVVDIDAPEGEEEAFDDEAGGPKRPLDDEEMERERDQPNP
jgi:hypothetical protein